MSAWDEHERERDYNELDEMLQFIMKKAPEITKEFLKTISESLSDSEALRSFSKALANSYKIQLDSFIQYGFTREEAMQLLCKGTIGTNK